MIGGRSARQGRREGARRQRWLLPSAASVARCSARMEVGGGRGGRRGRAAKAVVICSGKGVVPE